MYESVDIFIESFRAPTNRSQSMTSKRSDRSSGDAADRSKKKRQRSNDESKVVDALEDVDLRAVDGDATVVQVDFNFRDFDSNIDFHSTKDILEKGTCGRLLGTNFGSDLTNAVVSQKAVGTVVDVDEFTVGLTTILNLKTYGENNAVRALVAAIGLDVPKKGVSGLLLCEGLVNMPIECHHPLMKCLLDDVEWANKNWETTGQADENEFHFGSLLYVCPAYQDNGEKLDFLNVRDEVLYGSSTSSKLVDLPRLSRVETIEKTTKPTKAVGMIIRFSDLSGTLPLMLVD